MLKTILTICALAVFGSMTAGEIEKKEESSQQQEIVCGKKKHPKKDKLIPEDEQKLAACKRGGCKRGNIDEEQTEALVCGPKDEQEKSEGNEAGVLLGCKGKKKDKADKKDSVDSLLACKNCK